VKVRKSIERIRLDGSALPAVRARRYAGDTNTLPHDLGAVAVNPLARCGWNAIACVALCVGPTFADEPATPAASTAEIHVKLIDETGNPVVARLLEGSGGRVAVQPDGELSMLRGVAEPTDEPFVPDTVESLAERLSNSTYKQFSVLTKPHYLVFYQSRKAFAQSSANLLESLYTGLLRKLKEKGLPVHDAEFPLVAVIYKTEADFRAEHRVDPDVQAFYNVGTNRIYLYEQSQRDRDAPDVSALRKPQTVAHEGTHQVLQNIGVQPRLAPWPLWLAEGFAEYCAPTSTTKRGDWAGAGVVNPFHMATIRDLNDPMTPNNPFGEPAPPIRDRIRREPQVEPLIAREHLDPADYARAWAVTHYLASRKFPQFLAYLKEMEALPPLATRTPQEQKDHFTRHFGSDFPKLDRAVNRYLGGLKGFRELPYYLVTFEQTIEGGMIRRGAIVSQSSAMVSQWLDRISSPNGQIPLWHAWPFPTKARASFAADQWLRNGRQ
jgi:hypothetical protein